MVGSQASTIVAEEGLVAMERAMRQMSTGGEVESCPQEGC